jgi:co-chaperonin GroES (HSP10)
LRIEAEDYLIMKESDILGIIQSECAAQKAA